jgi:Anti-sigma factor NepR
MRSANKRAGLMPNRLSGDWLYWCQTKERIGEQLRQYYSECMTEELPPRLLTALKKLDEVNEASAGQVKLVRR